MKHVELPRSTHVQSLALVLGLEGASMRTLIADEKFAAAVRDAADLLAEVSHALSVEAGWHHDPLTGAWKDRNKGEMLALIHSEVSEALEGERKNLMDDHLPEFGSPVVELGDALIRITDYTGRFGYPLGAAVVAKLRFNAVRPDHKLEVRAKEGGKAF